MLSRLHLSSLLAFAFCLVIVPFAFSDQRELQTESSKLDAVLLLDSSGSMLATDPQRLRDEGAKLFTQLLRPGDRVAVIQFDRQAKVVHRFSDFSPEEIKKVNSDISSIGAQGQYTDLLAGVEAARELLKSDKRADANGVIVLMSDGKMDPDPVAGTAANRSEQLLNTILPELKATGIKINTVYFSDQADKQLLSEIALATEGASSFANSVENIHKSFADLFLAVKKPQVVPLTGRGFTMDSDVQEATFYLNKEGGADLAIITPSNVEIRPDSVSDNVKWFSGQKFDVITIERPESGQWQVKGLTSQDGFATVLTNLKLVSDWPNAVTSESPTILQVRLNEGDKPVVLPEVSTNTRYGVQIVPTHKVAEPVFEEPLYDDGTHGDKVAGDGIFSQKITLVEPGEYKMWLVAKAPTFERRQQLPFKVRPPLVQIIIEHEEEGAEVAHPSGEHKAPDASAEKAAAHEGVSEEHAKPDEHTAPSTEHTDTHEQVASSEASTEPSHAEATPVRILIKLSTEALQLRNIDLKLMAIDENRKRFLIPIEKGHDPSEYEVVVKGFPHSGLYTLQATLKGEAKKKGEIEEESKPIKFMKLDSAEPDAVVAIALEEKPKDTGPNPWPWAGLLLLLNGGTAFGLLKILKKLQSNMAVAVPVFAPADTALAALAALQQRSELTSIDFNDPLLDGEVILPAPSAAVAAVPTPAPEAAPQTTEQAPAADQGATQDAQAAEETPTEEKE